MEHKFQYLIQATIPKSPAHDLVVSFPPTADNYPKAIEYMKSRFGNKKILIEIYIRELLKLVLNNSISNQKNSVTAIYDKLETQLPSLESLGVTKDNYAAMLYPLVESTLPLETLQAWQRARNQMSDQVNEDELSSIMTFLRNEVDLEIRMKLAKTSITTEIEKSAQQHSTAMFSKKSTFDKDDVCYFCKKPGHIKPHCKQFQKWMERQTEKDKFEQQRKEVRSAHTAEANSSSDDEDVSKNYSLSVGNLKANKWILDSGARRHACHNKKHFHNLDESYRNRIKVANGEYLSVMGIGTMNLKLMTTDHKVRTVTVNKVLYVPKLIGSVLSVSTLTNLNYRVEFDRFSGKMKYNDTEVGIADVTKDGIFIMRQPKRSQKRTIVSEGSRTFGIGITSKRACKGVHLSRKCSFQEE